MRFRLLNTRPYTIHKILYLEVANAIAFYCISCWFVAVVGVHCVVYDVSSIVSSSVRSS